MSLFSGSWEIWAQGTWAGLASWSMDSHLVVFSPSESLHKYLGTPFMRVLMPFMRTFLLWPSHPLEALPPPPICLELRFSTTDGFVAAQMFSLYHCTWTALELALILEGVREVGRWIGHTGDYSVCRCLVASMGPSPSQEHSDMYSPALKETPREAVEWQLIKCRCVFLQA